MSTTITSRDRLIDILSLSYLGDLLREQLGDDAENYTWPDDFEKAVADIGFSAVVMRGDTSPYEVLVFGAGLETRTRTVGVGYGGSTKIRKIRFFGDVRRIPPYGLIDETLLSDIVLPDNLVEISNYGLANTGFSSIVIPDTVLSIGASAFQNSKIESINTKNARLSGNAAFSDCKSLTHVEMPEAEGTIPYQTFKNCTSLVSVHLPKYTNFAVSTTAQTFVDCASMEECVLGSVGYPVTAIGTQTFLRCTQSGLIITIYTVSAYMSDVIAKTRNTATNATIIIKAAADIEYNGTTYQAGDTVLTSTP